MTLFSTIIRLLSFTLCLATSVIQSRASATNQLCKNTAQGLHYIADDSGQLCQRDKLDSTSGCCSFAQLDACLDCHQASGCCSEFEMCVSCCMKPQNEPAKRKLQAPRGNNKPETGFFNKDFDYCRAKCRTNSKSTVHENAYQSNFHHCYGSNFSPVRADLAVGNFTIVKSPQGANCNEACLGSHSKCIIEAMAQVNSCATLKQHFPCENGCAESFGEDQPAYVVPSALRMHRPGTCMVNQRLELMSCAGKHPNTQRLCPCKNR
mmetsp:Transcript_13483/g.18474  ORF Transcript_13483/g.18474 Transcript_13483/m.18474 type:complete len:264 (+) Transcript_13483:381-1172(+)|eukprot:CAMPEP_0196587384 /NCGR_PEP_ID=MMETSP1081-20130531/57304_1 /TAXON_ID=36882 /ORGANISM="Pyramimonas amylifera, Strain CCMP720" /LENGTH=263 /DNA_ID=CAMNT_0041909563 /DNA_START=379 /DNA_END=1170 /DNA_ORIENTATION=-